MGHTVVCYFGAGKKRGRRLAEAFAAAAHGVHVEGGARLYNSPAFFYGVTPDTRPVWRAARAEGRRWFYCDNAYFGHGQYFRVTEGRLQHDGLAGAPDYTRLAQLAGYGGRPRSWRAGGRHILICPPGEAFMDLTDQGQTAAAWLADIRRRLAALTDRPIRVRPKPTKAAPAPPLEADLAGAWCLVTHMSNTAVEAIMAGVPAIVTGASAAAPMATSLEAIETPARPDGRRAWAARLAANQWTRREIATGLAWRALNGG